MSKREVPENDRRSTSGPLSNTWEDISRSVFAGPVASGQNIAQANTQAESARDKGTKQPDRNQPTDSQQQSKADATRQRLASDDARYYQWNYQWNQLPFHLRVQSNQQHFREEQMRQLAKSMSGKVGEERTAWMDKIKSDPKHQVERVDGAQVLRDGRGLIRDIEYKSGDVRYRMFNYDSAGQVREMIVDSKTLGVQDWKRNADGKLTDNLGHVYDGLIELNQQNAVVSLSDARGSRRFTTAGRWEQSDPNAVPKDLASIPEFKQHNTERGKPETTRKTGDWSISSYKDGTQVWANSVSGCQMTKLRDGTQITEFKDGRITINRADGAVVTKSPDGFLTYRDRFGDGVVQRPNGEQLKLPKEVPHDRYAGHKFETQKDGSKRYEDASVKVTRMANGDQVEEFKSEPKTKITTKSDGSKIFENSDGTTVTEKNDGTKLTQWKDHSMAELPDGTIVLDERKTHGFMLTTTADGTQITDRNDGTKIIEKTDGSKLTFSADGKLTSSTSRN